MGERFGPASRPGPRQWAALARALELCRTQPSACPWAPSSPAGLRPEGLEDPREKAATCFSLHLPPRGPLPG